MRQNSTLIGVAAWTLAFWSTVASANVIDPNVSTANKTKAKLRADIGKQSGKYALCLFLAQTSGSARYTPPTR